MTGLNRQILWTMVITMTSACSSKDSGSPTTSKDTVHSVSDVVTQPADTQTPSETEDTFKAVLDTQAPTDEGVKITDTKAVKDASQDTKPTAKDTASPPNDTKKKPIIALPNYTQRVLCARANFGNKPTDAFNLPTNHFFTNANIQINNSGQVAFHLTQTPDNRHKLWLGTSEGGEPNGQIVYMAPPGAFMRQPSMNAAGSVAFELTSAPTDGVYVFQLAENKAKLWTEEPMGALGRAGLTINNASALAFRAKFSSGKAYISVKIKDMKTYAKESKLDKQSLYEFLFVPAFNNPGQMAGLVRIAESNNQQVHDEIRVWNADGTSHLIAADVDGDPQSPYQTFDSQKVNMDDDGRVVFQATLTDGERGIFLSDGNHTYTIAKTGKQGVEDIGFFSPDINDKGWVVFRGLDDKGQAIFVGNGQHVMRIVGEHDKVMTDAGPAQIDEKDDKAAVFGGSPTINDKGHVAFNASLSPEGTPDKEWGKGVFVARGKHQ